MKWTYLVSRRFWEQSAHFIISIVVDSGLGQTAHNWQKQRNEQKMSEFTFEFERAISRQEDDRKRLLESQGLARDPQSGNVILGRGRGVVCRHWLRGMCWKGEFCEFLHQYDTGRMPVCRQFQKTGQCADFDRGNCVFLHERIEEGPPCVHYYLGFCRAGPKCRKRHHPLDKGQLPPLVPDWYLRLAIENAGLVIPQSLDSETEEIMEQVEATCRELAGIGSLNGVGKNKIKLDGYTTVLPDQSAVKTPTERTGRQSKRPMIDENILMKAQTQGIPRLVHTTNGPYKIRVFMIKSSDLKNIYKSIRMGVWATGKQNTRLLEQAYAENDHVVLLFSANESGGFQGYARMGSPPIPGLHPNLWGSFSVRLGPNFHVQWLKQCKVEFEKFAGLTNPLNSDQPIRKSRDCQELPLTLAQIVCTVLEEAPDEPLMDNEDQKSAEYLHGRVVSRQSRSSRSSPYLP